MQGFLLNPYRWWAVACALAVLATAQIPRGSLANSGESLDAVIGQAIFEKIWISAPASTRSGDGLGPLFNARSCESCHEGGGRAIFAVPADGPFTDQGLVLRLGRADGGADPVYGRQLQTHATQGHAAEGKIMAAREIVALTIASENSAPIILTRPVWSVNALAYGPLRDTTRVAGRVAPTLFGSGLIEDVPESAVLAFADPDDSNGDGISGRPNWTVSADGSRRLGRFGWKAAEPSLTGQIAAAFNTDLGLSTPLRPSHAGDCTVAQRPCLAAPHGAGPNAVEVGSPLLALVKQYVRSLPTPQAGNDHAGRVLFETVGCAACHRPTLPVKNGTGITAFTDLLLHDMGPRLADGIREEDASGREWRTPPLWDLGKALKAETGLLHDGRARTAEQAILWHGGEGNAARARFLDLPTGKKSVLIRFLQSL